MVLQIEALLLAQQAIQQTPQVAGLIGQVLADDDVEGRCCPIRLARGDTAGDQRRNLAQRLSTDGSGG